MRSIKQLIGAALLASAASVGATGAAHAEGEFSGNVALTSNYVWRGQTQSDGEFAIQGGLDYASDLFYVGAWASSVDDFGIDASTELDFYAGVTPTIGPVTLDIGTIMYFYPDTDVDSDFIELKVGASYSPIEPLSLSVAAYASNDYLATGGDSLYLEFTGGYAIRSIFHLRLAVRSGYAADTTLGTSAARSRSRASSSIWLSRYGRPRRRRGIFLHHLARALSRPVKGTYA